MSIRLFFERILNNIRESSQPVVKSQTSIDYNQVGIFNASLAGNENMTTLYSATPARSTDGTPTGTIPPDSETGAKRPEMGIIDPLSPEVTDEIGRDATVHLMKTDHGREVDFTFNRADMESYIINEATDKDGNKIHYFEKIPEIRAKAPEERTEKEAKLLEEFDNMMNFVIAAGMEYGVDPKFILSIIQREVGFQGLSSRVTGKNGNGYMQLTSIVVTGILGGTRTGDTRSSDEYYNDRGTTLKEFMTKKFGEELVELLESKGFDLSCSKAKDKKALADKIWKYIQDNKDPEFNIRLGTIWLRYHLDKAGGNEHTAAKNYNGSKSKESYARGVQNNYSAISNHRAY